jgi:glycosyltransferase involved in cell wall biosynthesis
MYTSNSVDVIPFGIDTGMFFPAKGAKLHTDRPLTFGIVKTMEHIYGIDTSVRGFHRLLALHPGLSAKLVIAGGGTQTDSYRKLAVELGIGDRVEFRGRIPYEDVPAFLQQTDIFLNMSRMESFGVSVLEASACGIPVVASKTGGLKGVVIEGETGFLVDPEDTETLADRMWRLADDPGLRSSFGNRGKEMVQNQFNFTKNLEEMITLYRQVKKESR